MEVTVRMVVFLVLPNGKWTPLLRITINGERQKDVTPLLISGTTDLYAIKFQCPRNSSLVTQLGKRRGQVCDLDLPQDQGWIAPKTMADDCFITSQWGGICKKIYIPPGIYTTFVNLHGCASGRVRVCGDTLALGMWIPEETAAQVSVNINNAVSVIPILLSGPKHVVFKLMNVAGDRVVWDDQHKAAELFEKDLIVCSSWGCQEVHTTEFTFTDLHQAPTNRILPDSIPLLRMRTESNSDPVLFASTTNTKDHKIPTECLSASLIDVETEILDVPPPADDVHVRGKVGKKKKAKKSTADKFLSEYTKMNRDRVKEHRRTVARERFWSTLQKRMSGCLARCNCVCANRHR